jgi:hypothetical protein
MSSVGEIGGGVVPAGGALVCVLVAVAVGAVDVVVVVGPGAVDVG